MKKIIKIGFWIFIVAVLGWGFYHFFISEDPLELKLFTVIKGDVSQEVQETGILKTENNLRLNFEIGGKIKEILIVEGQDVKKGDILAKIDKEVFEAQLQEAKIALNLTKTQVNISEISLNISLESLENIKIKSEIGLDKNYKTALIALKSSNSQIETILNKIDFFQKTYFTRNNQDGINIRRAKNQIQGALDLSSYHLKILKIDPSRENINLALLEQEKSLNYILEALNSIHIITDQEKYSHIISFSKSSTIITHQDIVIASLNSISNVQQAILLNQADIKANIDLAISKISLNKEKVFIAILSVEQVEKKIGLLNIKIQKTYLYSPVAGKIIKINKKVGEIFQPMLPVPLISLLPSSSFQVEVFIFEEDIIKVEVGDFTKITFIAFLDEVLMGEVYSIDFTETIIGGVVHYKTIIDFKNKIEHINIKPGMTADIIIITENKEAVIVVDEDAIYRKDGNFMVRVYAGGLIEERIIEVGLRGEDDLVEIISGLKEGEIIIIK